MAKPKPKPAKKAAVYIPPSTKPAVKASKKVAAPVIRKPAPKPRVALPATAVVGGIPRRPVVTAKPKPKPAARPAARTRAGGGGTGGIPAALLNLLSQQQAPPKLPPLPAYQPSPEFPSELMPEQQTPEELQAQARALIDAVYGPQRQQIQQQIADEAARSSAAANQMRDIFGSLAGYVQGEAGQMQNIYRTAAGDMNTFNKGYVDGLAMTGQSAAAAQNANLAAINAPQGQMAGGDFGAAAKLAASGQDIERAMETTGAGWGSYVATLPGIYARMGELDIQQMLGQSLARQKEIGSGLADLGSKEAADILDYVTQLQGQQRTDMQSYLEGRYKRQADEAANRSAYNQWAWQQRSSQIEDAYTAGQKARQAKVDALNDWLATRSKEQTAAAKLSSAEKIAGAKERGLNIRAADAEWGRNYRAKLSATTRIKIENAKNRQFYDKLDQQLDTFNATQKQKFDLATLARNDKWDMFWAGLAATIGKANADRVAKQMAAQQKVTAKKVAARGDLVQRRNETRVKATELVRKGLTSLDIKTLAQAHAQFRDTLTNMLKPFNDQGMVNQIINDAWKGRASKQYKPVSPVDVHGKQIKTRNEAMGRIQTNISRDMTTRNFPGGLKQALDFYRRQYGYTAKRFNAGGLLDQFITQAWKASRGVTKKYKPGTKKSGSGLDSILPNLPNAPK